MFPWEHVAFAYVLFSLISRLYYRRAPSGGPVLVAALASLLPDLVDKPLGWTFGITQSGISVAHSLLVGVPVVVAVGYVLWRLGRGNAGLALVVGHISHVAGDMLYHAVTGDYIVSPFLWPVVVIEDSPGKFSLFARFFYYMDIYVEGVMSGEYLGYVVLQAVMFVFVLGLWYLDGFPVLAELRRVVARSL